MNRKVGLFTALGVAVLLISGLVAGVALAQGGGEGDAQGEREGLLARVASHLGVTEQQLTDAFEAARLEMVDEAVTAGKITQEQADRIRERIEEGDGLGFGWGGCHMRPFGGIVSSVAETLDMTPREILQGIRQGQSLAEIGQAKGVSPEELKSAILSAADSKLDQAVANGRITQEQADKIMTRLTDNIDKLLNWKSDGLGRGLLGRGMRMDWGAGPEMRMW